MDLRLEGGPLDGRVVTIDDYMRERLGAIYTGRDDDGVRHVYSWSRPPRDPARSGSPCIAPGKEGVLVYGGSFSPTRSG